MIYITGDTHADFDRLETKKIKKNDTLIVCGDFGFIWTGDDSEKKVLKKIGNLPFKTLFVDGTHENFDLLSEYPKEEFGGSVSRHIIGNLHYLMRGQVYDLEGKKIFTFGGGDSDDKYERMLCSKWWPEESPTVKEMKAAVEVLNSFDREVDYIVTHEPPAKIKPLFNKGYKIINPLNRFFDDVSKEVRYKKWFFGSTHETRLIAQKYQSVFSEILPLE